MRANYRHNAKPGVRALVISTGSGRFERTTVSKLALWTALCLFLHLQRIVPLSYIWNHSSMLYQ